MGTEQNGSMQAVAGSGPCSMSLLLIALQPRIDDPSSPDPSLNRPSVSSLTGIVKCCSVEKWTKISEETLADSARSFIVEIDSADKAGVLSIASPLAMGYGDIECVQNIGSGPETTHHSTNPTLLPLQGDSLPLLVKGAATGSAIIASGSATVNSSQALNNLGVGFAVDVQAPLKIKVRWELKKI